MTDQTGTRQPTDAQLLKVSLDVVAPRADQLIASFYDRLFAAHPEVRPMFPAIMDTQHERLLKAVIALVTHYENPDALLPALTAMGARHAGYGVQLEHYGAVAEALLATLREYAGDAWTPEIEAAWTNAYTFAAGAMVQGASEAEAAATAGRQAA
jgi:methyl-accepting chemotaxis protein